jgi:hypothetical protein
MWSRKHYLFTFDYVMKMKLDKWKQTLQAFKNILCINFNSYFNIFPLFRWEFSFASLCCDMKQVFSSIYSYSNPIFMKILLRFHLYLITKSFTQYLWKSKFWESPYAWTSFQDLHFFKNCIYFIVFLIFYH